MIIRLIKKATLGILVIGLSFSVSAKAISIDKIPDIKTGLFYEAHSYSLKPAMALELKEKSYKVDIEKIRNIKYINNIINRTHTIGLDAVAGDNIVGAKLDYILVPIVEISIDLGYVYDLEMNRGNLILGASFIKF